MPHQMLCDCPCRVQGAIASCAAPLVGIIAQKGFGFDGSAMNHGGASSHSAGGDSGHADLRNAAALGNSLLLCLCAPWSLCFLIYFGLYRTYPADRAKLKSSRTGTPDP